MKTFFLILGLAVLSVSAWGDELTKSVQQKLKDQGFFYGEATGQPGSETDAAIRRYQIRYGLKVTGSLNDETMHSLGLKAGDNPPPQNAARHGNEAGTGTPNGTPQAMPPRSVASPTPRPHLATPRPTASEQARPRTEPQTPSYRTPPEEQEQGPNEETPENEPPHQGYNRGPSGGGNYGNPNAGPSYGGPSYGGPSYGQAPGRGRGRVVARVQMALARRGYYHGPVDGELGENTMDAIGRFQASEGLRPTGRPDGQTLAALHVVRRARRGYGPYGPYSPYRPYGPYGPYGPYARNYW